MENSQELLEAHKIHEVIHRDTNISVKFIKFPLNYPFEKGTLIPYIEDTKDIERGAH